MTAPPRLPVLRSLRDATPRRASRRASLSVESSPGCSDRQTRRSAERASTEVREGAMCVQRLDDSLNSAIRTTYRSSLRSSSKHEPRGPPLEVVLFVSQLLTPQFFNNSQLKKTTSVHNKAAELGRATASRWATTTAEGEARYFFSSTADTDPVHKTRQKTRQSVLPLYDPSAGSPTETLLRLLLPLEDSI